MILYSGPVSVFGAKTEIAALEKGLDLEVKHVPFTFQKYYNPKPDKTWTINPKGEVPYLEDGDFKIFDSTLICEFFEDYQPLPALWPESPKDRAIARVWELKADEIYFGKLVRMLMPARRKEQTGEEIRDVKRAIEKFQIELDEHLRANDFVARDFSYADVALFCASFFADFLGYAAQSELEHYEMWRTRLRKRASIKSVLGKMAELLNQNGVSARL